MKFILLCSIFIVTVFCGCTGSTENSVEDETTSNAAPNKNEVYDSSVYNSQSIQETTTNTQITVKTQNKTPLKNQREEIEKPFQKNLKSGKISFYVFSKNEAGINQLKIKTEGFEVINDSFLHKINGQITKAEVADLNKDGFPELYVFYTLNIKNKNDEGDIIAYNSNRNKSASPIYVRHPDKSTAAFKGYTGHDNFYIKDNKLLREFSTNDGDAGKKRISYKLIRGETSFILEMDKVE